MQFWSGNENSCSLPGCTAGSVTVPGGQSGPTNVTINYTYDPLDRLTAADYSDGKYFHYSYDAVGNRLTQAANLTGQPANTSYTYDSANRLTSVDGVPYTYDNNGNLLSDGTNTYAYDFANRLISVVGPSGTTTYAYNGLGDRLQQTENGVTTTFTMDLASDLPQVLDDGTNSYTYGIDRISQTTGADTEYFLGDALGSVRQLADTTGAVTLAKNYDPFGNMETSAGSGSSMFGYTGEQTDPTGMVYLRARYYNPAMGEFMTRDTWQGDINQPTSYNKWLYVYGNPVNNIDPTGHLGCSDVPYDSPARASCESSGNLDEYGLTLYGWKSSGNINEIKIEVKQIASKLESAYGSYCSNIYYSSYVNCRELGSSDLFHTVFGDLTIEYDPNHPTRPCDSMTPGKIICGSLAEQIYGCGTFLGPEPLAQGLHQITHEFGHQFDRAINGLGRETLGSSAIRTPSGDYVSGVINGNYRRTTAGYAHGGNMPGVSHIIDNNNTGCNGGSACEDFADMFMNWIWNSFDNHNRSFGDARYYWNDLRMGPWIALAVSGR